MKLVLEFDVDIAEVVAAVVITNAISVVDIIKSPVATAFGGFECEPSFGATSPGRFISPRQVGNSVNLTNQMEFTFIYRIHHTGNGEVIAALSNTSSEMQPTVFRLNNRRFADAPAVGDAIDA